MARTNPGARITRLVALAVLALALLSGAVGCGEDTTGKLVIGVKYDQPGLGQRTPDGALAGFDVDVAKYVAARLGYRESDIVWKEAPSGQRESLIQNGQVRLVVGTYTITDPRKQRVDFAGPYLVAGQSLMVRAGETDIIGPASLENNKRLCSVSGSTPAQRIKDKYPRVQLQQYDTYSACVEALRNGAIDAVSTDNVVLAGYASRDPSAFRIVGEPFSKEPYGIGLRKGDTQLRDKVNDAITTMIQDGSWKASFEANLGPSGIALPAAPTVDRYRDADPVKASTEVFAKYGGKVLAAFWVTIKLTIFSGIGALLLGTIVAALRVSPVPVLRVLGTAYVNIVRNTPLTLIIVFCSFGLAQTLGMALASRNSPTSIADSNFRLAVLGLTVYTAAFVCESVRAGINTVPIGQAEAARSLGLTFTQNLRLIVLPQAFRSVIGPLGSVLNALIKNTTIASAIGVAEAALLMKEMIENTAELLTVGAIFATGFVILTLPLGLAVTALGKRWAILR